MAERSADAVRGLTTRGRCLLAGGLAAIVCAVLLDERDLLRVGVLAAVLPLISLLVTATRKIRLEASHQVFPDKLRPGTVGQVVLNLNNSGAGRTSTLEVTEPPTPDLTPGLRCVLPSLRRGRSGQAVYRLYATRRGRFTLGPPRVRVSDPFGMWEDSRVLPVRTEVLVVPSVVALTGLPSGAGARSAASSRASVSSLGGDPDVGIRQYRNGDDIRTIHWRASARHDDLMVRLDEPVSHGGAAVLIDHRTSAHRGDGSGSSLEPAVTLAASVSLHLLANDHEVRLLSHTGRVLAQGHDIADDVLAGLAVIEPDAMQPISPVASGSAGLLVAILGDLPMESARLLAASKRQHVHGVALILDVVQWDPERRPANTRAIVDLLATAGWRVVTVQAGEDLAAVWRRACSSGDGFSTAVAGLTRTPGAVAAAAGGRRAS